MLWTRHSCAIDWLRRHSYTFFVVVVVAQKTRANESLIHLNTLSFSRSLNIWATVRCCHRRRHRRRLTFYVCFTTTLCTISIAGVYSKHAVALAVSSVLPVSQTKTSLISSSSSEAAAASSTVYNKNTSSMANARANRKALGEQPQRNHQYTQIIIIIINSV